MDKKQVLTYIGIFAIVVTGVIAGNYLYSKLFKAANPPKQISTNEKTK
ncbi:MAG: hypothetical protein PHX80_04685 [Candidatus Nanoarchaeia archaeon]|nr:hypothetical protein [Candidatus Nanoarchaeia archaeon]